MRKLFIFETGFHSVCLEIAVDQAGLEPTELYLTLKILQNDFQHSVMFLADDPKEKDGEGPPDTSQKSPEEFTDAKHESLFSLETNFLEEDSGGSSSQRASQGERGAVWWGCALTHAQSPDRGSSAEPAQ